MRLAIITALLVGMSLCPGRADSNSVLEEKKIGRRFSLEAAGSLPVIRDVAVDGLVRGVGRRLVDTLGAQPFEYRFQIVADPSLNAFAVPGGYIYIFSGLIERVSSVDELASVMGHEVAHAHAHHVVRQQQRAQLWNYANIVGILLSAVNPVLGAGAMGAAASARLKYSRDFEEEADFLGLGLMRSAGYDPAAMPRFFKKILGERRLNPAGVPPYLLTHPLTEDRVAKVETLLAAKPAPKRHPSAEEVRLLAEARAVVKADTRAPGAVLANYRRMAEERPADGFARYLLGIVYAETGRWESARTAFLHARELDGAGAYLPVRLARVYLGLGRAAEARTVLEAYLRRAGKDAEARAVMGQTLLELNEPQAAIAELERSVLLDPTLDESHRLLGQAYGKVGRAGEGFYQVAKACELRGRLAQALSHYARAREVLPDDDPRAESVRASIAELGAIVGEKKERRPR